MHEKPAQETLPDKPGVIALPPFIYLGGLILSLLLHWRKPLPLAPRFIRKRLGLPLIAVGAALFDQALRAMKRAHTNPNPEHPTTAIVVDGPFQTTRNPIYIAFALIYTGIGALFNTFWTVLTLPLILLIINRGVIDREERYLERKFGDEYLQYKSKVRRWL